MRWGKTGPQRRQKEVPLARKHQGSGVLWGPEGGHRERGTGLSTAMQRSRWMALERDLAQAAWVGQGADSSQTLLLKINVALGTSLMVQWLRPCASTAWGMGSIPGRGTKISHASWSAPLKKNFF